MWAVRSTGQDAGLRNQQYRFESYTAYQVWPCRLMDKAEPSEGSTVSSSLTEAPKFYRLLVELADTRDSKPRAREGVKVQLLCGRPSLYGIEKCYMVSLSLPR